ncbi:MAG: VWA domain-containing protein [Bacteroidota bacterium]|nr:VWA domain-containing protein [Bacteroidota bacterium]
MGLDEYLFGKAARYFKKKKLAEFDSQSRIVKLEDIKQRLTILSRALTGQPIEIFPAEREGGYKNNNFFLPGSFSKFATYEKNTSYYLFRILYLSVQKKLNLNWSGKNEYSAESSLKAGLENSPPVLRIVFEEFPATAEMHNEFVESLTALTPPNEKTDCSWLYGKWMRNEKEIVPESKLKNFTDKIKKAKENMPQTILKAKAVEEVISIEVDKKQQEDYVLTHNFEKVETADEFNGVWRDFDGEDELEKHMDALDELNMKFTVRVDDTAHSVYQSDFLENTNISGSEESESGNNFIPYDEWDFSKRIYKKDFCKLYPKRLLETNADYYKTTLVKYFSVLTGLRKLLSNVNNKLQQQKRQTQGNEFDIDAVTDLFTEAKSGHTQSEKIYLSSRKKEKDISILLLLDASLSSDGYADGNRVIDVEKQIAILFGEILNEYQVDFSINCFYSKTRNYSTYITLKGFDDDWNKGKYQIGAVSPSGYTRIGPALRHSGELLSKRSTKNKWVILVSDGKPNDFDTYEGKYGVNDVKQAIRELKEMQIHSYALAIESTAKYYLPGMFGQNHYQILSSPVQLLTSLVKLYERIKYQS